MHENLPLEIWTSTTRTTRSGRTTTAYLVLTFHTSRKSTRTCDNNSCASQKTKYVNTLTWGMFMIVTQQAAVQLGNDYLDKVHSTKNQSQRTMQQLFDVTRKLVSEQTETQGISMINWHENSWKRTALLTDRAFQSSTAKAYSPVPCCAWEESVKIP